MESSSAKVVSVAGDSAVILVDVAASCARCAAGRGCGAGVSIGTQQMRKLVIPVNPGMALRVGDRISVTLKSSYLLEAAVLAYGLPLFGLLLALMLGNWLAAPLGEPLATFCSLAGLAAGVFTGRRLLQRRACRQKFVPEIGAGDAVRSAGVSADAG